MLALQKNTLSIALAFGLLIGWQFIPAAAPFDPASWTLLSCLLCMVILWMTEALPIPITALLPLILFPLLGVDDIKSVASSYGHPIVFLFLGGFFLAVALEKSQLHERIALNILRLTGTSLRGVVLGFMLATALLSMFISNTATALMMLPIAISVLSVLSANMQEKEHRAFAVVLMLTIAYSANIGGTATLIGTPPNMVLVGFLEQQYGYHLDFLDWFMFGLPFASLMLLLMYGVLVFVLHRVSNVTSHSVGAVVQERLKMMGAMKRVEKRVLLIFACVVAGWVCKRYINSLFPDLGLSDTAIAMIGGMLMFTIRNGDESRQAILQWSDTSKVAWGIILLFGGGLALAYQLQQSGLVGIVGDSLGSLSTYHSVLLVGIVVTIVLVLTEIMSNVALISIFLPIIAGFAGDMDYNPLLFLIPSALAASCAFTMPISTPPNAIVFSSGHVHTYDMAKAGILLNIIAILLITLLSHSLMKWVFGL